MRKHRISKRPSMPMDAAIRRAATIILSASPSMRSAYVSSMKERRSIHTLTPRLAEPFSPSPALPLGRSTTKPVSAITAIRITRQPSRKRQTSAELARKIGLAPEVLVHTIEQFNAACRDDVPFDPTRLDGKKTHGLPIPKSNWAIRIENGAVSRLSGHVRDHVHLRRGEGQFESSGLEFDARADQGPIRVRRYCRAVLSQLPVFHRADPKRRLRPSRRGTRRRKELKSPAGNARPQRKSFPAKSLTADKPSADGGSDEIRLASPPHSVGARREGIRIVRSQRPGRPGDRRVERARGCALPRCWRRTARRSRWWPGARSASPPCRRRSRRPAAGPWRSRPTCSTARR